MDRHRLVAQRLTPPSMRLHVTLHGASASSHACAPGYTCFFGHAGDFETAQDLEFIIANKITRVINCSGREIANAWERSGIRYLTFYWPEAGNCVIFDDSNSVLDDLYAFIEEALDVGDSVLIHSTDGQSRAAFCACVYFMLKYKWYAIHLSTACRARVVTVHCMIQQTRMRHLEPSRAAHPPCHTPIFLPSLIPFSACIMDWLSAGRFRRL